MYKKREKIELLVTHDGVWYYHTCMGREKLKVYICTCVIHTVKLSLTFEAVKHAKIINVKCICKQLWAISNTAKRNFVYNI